MNKRPKIDLDDPVVISRTTDYLNNKNRVDVVMIDSDQEFSTSVIPLEKYTEQKIISPYEIGMIDDKHVLMYVGLDQLESLT